MDNSQIADSFSLLAKLMDIHGENSFKSRSYAITAFHIEKLEEQLGDIPHQNIFSIKGIGESSAKKIIEILDTGELQVLNDMLQKTPKGVTEMLNIKGIGPKKISVIWKEMEIESIGELLYACQENRLKLYKGFGEKTQTSVEDNIEFYLRNQGIFLFSEVETVFFQINSYLEKIFFPQVISVTGTYARHENTIEELEFVVNENIQTIKQKMITANPPSIIEEKEDTILFKLTNGLKLRFYAANNNVVERLFFTTGNKIFIDAFIKKYPATNFNVPDASSDKIIFDNAGIQYIEPYLRETENIINIASASSIPE